VKIIKLILQEIQVMHFLKKYGAIALFGLATVTTANASIITDQLYNTGLDSSGNLVAASGEIDGNWKVNPTGSSAITYLHTAYAANDADSQWISSNVSGGNETTTSTDYVFSTEFDLTGYDASTAMITGFWGVDNYASIWLNGWDTGNSLAFGVAAFNNLSAFAISDYFIDGYNQLTVKVTNGYDTDLKLEPGPMALRLDDLELSATAVPEPSIIALFGLGLVGLGFARRRRQA
jgi:hypothetical protein